MVYSESVKNDFISELIEVFSSMDRLPVFMCIGTDKVILDSLAPITAELLIKKYDIPAFIYGDLEYNINAKNLNYVKNFIDIMHPEEKVFVIDATLSNVDSVGQVKLVPHGVVPGVLNVENLKTIGDCAILGVVGCRGIRDKIILNDTKMQIVLDMAQFIAECISVAIESSRDCKLYGNRIL